MIAARTSRRLPGFQFEVRSPELPEALPRMDVALLVGFAASGPLHIPVAIEDVAQYTAIFGGDAPLAWDQAKGEPVFAYLAPAVRQFFQNGGRRCWVIRVAGRSARSNVFPIPGLTMVEFDDENSIRHVHQPALAQARSEGSWSDRLQVAAALQTETLRLAGLDKNLVIDVDARSVAVRKGDLLRLTFGDEYAVLLTVAGVNQKRVIPGRAVWFRSSGPVSPPAESPDIDVHISAADAPEPALDFLSRAELLTFELRVRHSDQDAVRFSNLGFVAGHPRFWGDVITDEEFFKIPPSAVGQARFPLAALGPRDALYLPLGMKFVFQEEAGRIYIPGSALERDGLSAFDSNVFLDEDLAEVSARTFMDQADFIRYLGPSPRRLRGIHAALGFAESAIMEEATLIAVPDAIHRGWESVDQPALRPAIPSLPLTQEPQWDQFLKCGTRAVPVPTLNAAVPDAGGTFRLSWSTSEPVTRYVLEESTEPDFKDSTDVIYEGPALEMVIRGRPLGDYYYQVRAEVDGATGNWSAPVAVRVQKGSEWRVKPAAEYKHDVLLAIQRALLRMCAGRGDLFGVLTVPEHYREREAVEHVRSLKSAFGYGEGHVFSYASLYHPWLIVPVEDRADVFRSSPPDGTAVGLIARRAITRGAWIAPANESLRGVVALTPPILPEYRLSLQDAQINLIRQEPRGFVSLNADTLSNDEELRQIGVRRLLILLRRQALRVGARYVFEPNDDSFRRLVQRGFEAMLEEMFARGAFAGATAGSSFQVVTSNSLNTPQSVEQGRFIVELKVAPSLPMTFMTIRLVQSGDRTTVTEGA